MPENINNSIGLPDDRWLKASVAGGLWAAFEIIIGSFLHNMRIPFAGSILASFAVVLMISFHRMWPVRGLIWRAGLICALMKSISPSALILGPMIGIMTEAVMLEIALRLFGRNRFAYIAGGVLGLSSTLIHKVVSILILYGADVVQVYTNMYRFAVKQIGIQDTDPWKALAVLLGVYMLAGAGAALAGLSIPTDQGNNRQQLPAEDLRLSGYDVSISGYSMPLLILHLASVPLLLLLMARAELMFSLPAILVWVVLLYLKYPGIYRRFRKPVLWFQFLIIILIAALFWETGCRYYLCFSLEGLKAGLLMSLRAVVVIVAFTAFSNELRNPVVKSFLERKGMKNLYLGISVAFSALPYMVAQIPPARQLIRHPRSAIAGALIRSREWLSRIETAAGP